MTDLKRCDFLVAHTTEGRIRLRRTDEAKTGLAEAAQAVCSLDRVRKVRYADLTGSLIIEHDYDNDGAFFEALSSQYDIVVGRETDVAPYAPPTVKAFVGDMDAAISRFSGGEFDLNTVFSATLLGLGLMQFRSGKVLPAGLTLLLQANSYFRPPPIPQEKQN